MPHVRLFSGHQLDPARAAQVVAPSYDALSACERHAYALAHPDNFLNAMRAVDDFPPGTAPAPSELLSENARWVRERISDGVYFPVQDCLFIYRLCAGEHVQRGVVAEMPVTEYLEGRLKRHEYTRPARENALADYIDRVGTASSPVCAAYREHPEIDRRVLAIESRAPDVVFTSRDGVRHALWRVSGDEARELASCFETAGAAYLTDGHHRCAATARFQTGGAQAGLLVALFPFRELRILSYHRFVTGLSASDRRDLLRALDACFDVSIVAERDAEPLARRDFAMYLDRQWRRLRWRANAGPSDDPVASLDVSILQEHVLGPVLGIDDPRDAERLGYVAGAKGLPGIRAVCERENAVGFAVHATSIGELIAVADAGEVMPPKSTWFDPKVRSGFFLNDPLRQSR